MKKDKATQKRRRAGNRYNEYYIRKMLEENDYQYSPSITAVSHAEFIVHKFLKCRYGGLQLVGVRALKETIMFLKTYEKVLCQSDFPQTFYKLALKVALKKVYGQRFTDVKETTNIIKSNQDVEQVIKECLRASNITTPVNEFLMNHA